MKGGEAVYKGKLDRIPTRGLSKYLASIGGM